MKKSIDNQIKFSFWSSELSLGLNSPRDVYQIIDGDLYKLTVYINRGTLRYKLKSGKTISYQKIKGYLTERNKVVVLNPLPF